jgi:hypothetical protein
MERRTYVNETAIRLCEFLVRMSATKPPHISGTLRTTAQSCPVAHWTPLPLLLLFTQIITVTLSPALTFIVLQSGPRWRQRANASSLLIAAQGSRSQQQSKSALSLFAVGFAFWQAALSRRSFGRGDPAIANNGNALVSLKEAGYGRGDRNDPAK